MNSEQFCYWLQGFSEMNGDKPPSYEQWKMIKEHLSLVFNKVTPPLNPGAFPYISPTYPTGPYIGDPMDGMPRVICGVSTPADGVEIKGTQNYGTMWLTSKDIK